MLGARERHWSDLPGLAQCMRASMLLPGICGPTITLESMGGKKEPLADAMLFEPIPYRAALAEGANDLEGADEVTGGGTESGWLL